MGFFSKLFSVTSCRNCGSTDLPCGNQLYGSNCNSWPAANAIKYMFMNKRLFALIAVNLCGGRHIIAAEL